MTAFGIPPNGKQEYIMKDKPRSIYWNRMVEIIDENFPKGKCKERGAALVMLAEIEMMLQGMKAPENTNHLELE